MISNNKYYNIFIIKTITYYLAHFRGARIAHWLRGGLEGLGVPGSSPAAAEIFPWCTHMQLPKLFKFVV